MFEMQKSEKIFAVVGDNGFGVATCEKTILQAVRNLVYVTINSMPSEEVAIRYAYCAYTSRFYMRNSIYGIGPTLPINLSTDYFFVDPDYERREGGRPPRPPFPGLPL